MVTTSSGALSSLPRKSWPGLTEEGCEALLQIGFIGIALRLLDQVVERLYQFAASVIKRRSGSWNESAISPASRCRTHRNRSLLLAQSSFLGCNPMCRWQAEVP